VVVAVSRGSQLLRGVWCLWLQRYHWVLVGVRLRCPEVAGTIAQTNKKHFEKKTKIKMCKNKIKTRRNKIKTFRKNENKKLCGTNGLP